MFHARLVQGPSESLWAIGLFLSLSPNGDFERQALISSHMDLPSLQAPSRFVKTMVREAHARFFLCFKLAGTVAACENDGARSLRPTAGQTPSFASFEWPNPLASH